MTITALDICEAVVEELADPDQTSAGTFDSFDLSAAGCCVAAAVPEYDLETIQDLRVTVTPSAIATVVLTRAEDQRTYSIDVGVQKRLVEAPSTDLTAIKVLLLLVERIAAFMTRRKLSTLSDVTVKDAANIDPPWIPSHLIESRVFTSVIRLTYFASIPKLAGA